jgi:hypothetical protein
MILRTDSGSEYRVLEDSSLYVLFSSKNRDKETCHLSVKRKMWL